MKKVGSLLGAITHGRYSLVHRYPILVPPMALTAALLAVGVSGPALTYAAGQGYTFRIVAKLGDPAPGGAVHKDDFEPQDIYADGTVISVSDVPGVPSAEGLFRSRRGVNSRPSAPVCPRQVPARCSAPSASSSRAG